jgi:hypothetical protein
VSKAKALLTTLQCVFGIEIAGGCCRGYTIQHDRACNLDRPRRVVVFAEVSRHGILFRCNVPRYKASYVMRSERCDRQSFRWRKKGTTVMSYERMDTSWTELLTALAVLAVIAMLWLF